MPALGKFEAATPQQGKQQEGRNQEAAQQDRDPPGTPEPSDSLKKQPLGDGKGKQPRHGDVLPKPPRDAAGLGDGLGKPPPLAAGLGVGMDDVAGSSFLQFYMSTELQRRARELQRENDLMREREVAEERERVREREERRERERAEERQRQMLVVERAARQREREDAERDMQLLMMLMKRKK